MDTARCTEDNRIYTAIGFSELNLVELERKRRRLECIECGGPAFFSNFSSNGRTAYFGARPHAYGCQLASQDHEQYFDDQGDEIDAINNPAERIVIDLSFGAQERSEKYRTDWRRREFWSGRSAFRGWSSFKYRNPSSVEHFAKRPSRICRIWIIPTTNRTKWLS